MILIPLCSAVITFSNMDDRYGNYFQGHITIDTRISEEDKEYTLIHELGHHYQHLFGTNWHARKSGFGKAPFVTEYAKQSVGEHVAESFAHKLSGGTLPPSQNRYIRKLIAEGKKCSL